MATGGELKLFPAHVADQAEGCAGMLTVMGEIIAGSTVLSGGDWTILSVAYKPPAGLHLVL
jgi:hypothetical protein